MHCNLSDHEGGDVAQIIRRLDGYVGPVFKLSPDVSVAATRNEHLDGFAADVTSASSTSINSARFSLSASSKESSTSVVCG
jgi:hypothetical protein